MSLIIKIYFYYTVQFVSILYKPDKHLKNCLPYMTFVFFAWIFSLLILLQA